MKYVSLFVVGLAFATLSASSAEARRFRIPIPFFFGGESIDLVYDLPNEQPFMRDGEFLDIGYLNSRKGNAYVLYHGDRYNKLSDGDIALFTGILGFDPTAEHRAKLGGGPESETAKPQAVPSPNVIVRQPDESREAFAARTKAFVDAHRSSATQGAARHHNAPSSSAPIWSGFMSVIVYIAILFFLARTIFRRIRHALGAKVPRDDQFADAANAVIDERATDRLTKLHAEMSSKAYVADHAGRYASARVASGGSPVRTFGRRNA
jgi:hypothetical protein